MTQADFVWDRACGQDALRSLPGDRALVDLLYAHGLVMNGGVLHAVECLTTSELSDAESGFRYFGFDGVASLLSCAKGILDAGEDLDRHEELLDGQYAYMISSDSALCARFEQRFKSHPSDFAPLRTKDTLPMGPSSVATLGNDARVVLMDAYGDGTIWASLEDGLGRRTQVCIDGRQGRPTRHRLFEQARHPRQQSARLIDLGAPEEGIVVPLLSGWLDSGEARKLGLTEYGKEIIKAGLLALGEPPWKHGFRLLEIIMPRMQQSEREHIARNLAEALEAEHGGELTGGGFGRDITDIFVGVVEVSAGLALIRRILGSHEAAAGSVIRQYDPVQRVYPLEE